MISNKNVCTLFIDGKRLIAGKNFIFANVPKFRRAVPVGGLNADNLIVQASFIHLLDIAGLYECGCVLINVHNRDMYGCTENKNTKPAGLVIYNGKRAIKCEIEHRENILTRQFVYMNVNGFFGVIKSKRLLLLLTARDALMHGLFLVNLSSSITQRWELKKLFMLLFQLFFFTSEVNFSGILHHLRL